MPRALQVARAQLTVDCSCEALSARASCGTSAPAHLDLASGFRGVDPARERPSFAHAHYAFFLPPKRTGHRRRLRSGPMVRLRILWPEATSTPGNRAEVYRAAYFALLLQHWFSGAFSSRALSLLSLSLFLLTSTLSRAIKDNWDNEQRELNKVLS